MPGRDAPITHHQQEEEEQQYDGSLLAQKHKSRGAALGAGCARDVHSQLTVGLRAMHLLT